jgi:hypothetical protein
MIAKSLSQHDEKHVVPTPLSGIRVGKRRRIKIILQIQNRTWYIRIVF